LTGVRQHLADLLDPMSLAMIVDQGDHELKSAVELRHRKMS